MAGFDSMGIGGEPDRVGYDGEGENWMGMDF